MVWVTDADVEDNKYQCLCFPCLSPGIAGVSFLLCNTVPILNAQVLYKEDLSPGTAIGKTPEMLRVKQTQDHISSVKTPTPSCQYLLPPSDIYIDVWATLETLVTRSSWSCWNRGCGEGPPVVPCSIQQFSWREVRSGEACVRATQSRTVVTAGNPGFIQDYCSRGNRAHMAQLQTQEGKVGIYGQRLGG